MKNVSMKAEGNELVIRIDMTKTIGASKSGKNQMVASTFGVVPFLNGEEVISVNLNVYKK